MMAKVTLRGTESRSANEGIEARQVLANRRYRLASWQFALLG